MVILDDGTRIPVKDLFEKDAGAKVKENFFPLGITDRFALETLEFLKAIWEDRRMETNGKQGLRDLAVCYAVIEASRLKRAVKVDDVESSKIGEYEKEINAYYRL